MFDLPKLGSAACIAEMHPSIPPKVSSFRHFTYYKLRLAVFNFGCYTLQIILHNTCKWGRVEER